MVVLPSVHATRWLGLRNHVHVQPCVQQPGDVRVAQAELAAGNKRVWPSVHQRNQMAAHTVLRSCKQVFALPCIHATR